MVLRRFFHPDRHDKFLSLFVALLLLVVLYPYFEGGRYSALFWVFMAVAIPFAGVYAAADSRRQFIIALVLCIPAQIAAIEYLLRIDILPLGNATLSFTFLFYAFTLYVVARAVLRSETVTRDTLFGAASVYLLLGFTWALAYDLVEQVRPGSFNINESMNPDGVLDLLDFLYSSFVTLTTLGYGDVTPITAQAQSLALLQAVVGVLYLAFLIGRLVGIYSAASAKK